MYTESYSSSEELSSKLVVVLAIRKVYLTVIFFVVLNVVVFHIVLHSVAR